jgi:serine/threonine protein kinase
VETKKIDELIQEMQLKINNYYDKIIEWISYNQFINIKVINKGGSGTLYSAIWMDGPLEYNLIEKNRERKFNKEVVLKCLLNSHNSIREFINKVYNFNFMQLNLITYINVLYIYIYFNSLNHILIMLEKMEYMEYHKIQIRKISSLW